MEHTYLCNRIEIIIVVLEEQFHLFTYLKHFYYNSQGHKIRNVITHCYTGILFVKLSIIMQINLHKLINLFPDELNNSLNFSVEWFV
jgi:hypothetical protein